VAEWTLPALADFNAAMEFIARDDMEAARAVAARIHAAVSRLEAYPGLGAPGRRTGTRELVLPRIPFLIVYRERGRQVTILRLLHSSRMWP